MDEKHSGSDADLPTWLDCDHVASAAPVSRRLDAVALAAEICRRLYERCELARRHGEALIERSRAVCSRSEQAREHARLLREQSVALRARAGRRDASLRWPVVPPVLPPAAVAPGAEAPEHGRRRRAGASKLAHKNRWLISVDVVAALARAGVVCDILVPGGTPWREKHGLTTDHRRH